MSGNNNQQSYPMDVDDQQNGATDNNADNAAPPQYISPVQQNSVPIKVAQRTECCMNESYTDYSNASRTRITFESRCTIQRTNINRRLFDDKRANEDRAGNDSKRRKL